MAIKINSLLNEKAGRFGASQASAPFQQQFLDNLAYVLDHIDNRLGLSTSRPVSTSAEIDLDEQMYRGTIAMGLDYYFGLDGQWQVKSDTEMRMAFEDALRSLLMRYQKTLDLGAKLGDVDTEY